MSTHTKCTDAECNVCRGDTHVIGLNPDGHFHDCAWGAGGKHRCVDPECKPEDYDEPPRKEDAYHG